MNIGDRVRVERGVLQIRFECFSLRLRFVLSRSVLAVQHLRTGSRGAFILPSRVFFHGSFLLPRLLRRVEDRLWEVRGE